MADSDLTSTTSRDGGGGGAHDRRLERLQTDLRLFSRTASFYLGINTKALPIMIAKQNLHVQKQCAFKPQVLRADIGRRLAGHTGKENPGVTWTFD